MRGCCLVVTINMKTETAILLVINKDVQYIGINSWCQSFFERINIGPLSKTGPLLTTDVYVHLVAVCECVGTGRGGLVAMRNLFSHVTVAPHGIVGCLTLLSFDVHCAVNCTSAFFFYLHASHHGVFWLTDWALCQLPFESRWCECCL